MRYILAFEVPLPLNFQLDTRPEKSLEPPLFEILLFNLIFEEIALVKKYTHDM